MDEQLLVSMYGKKAMDTVPVPGNAEVDKFIAEHPAMFADRTRYALNQLQFDMPADANRLKELESANSIEDVANRLTAMGIKFEQGKGALDSAVVPEQVISRINSLPAGEPFIVPQGNKVVVSVVTGTEKVALPPERARPIAAQALRAQSLNKIGEDRLKEAKAKAKIEYQAGYEAPKADAKESPAKS